MPSLESSNRAKCGIVGLAGLRRLAPPTCRRSASSMDMPACMFMFEGVKVLAPAQSFFHMCHAELVIP
ncbi:hypothetical protein IMZ48_20520 [Candidatus Bathyarchaeota archaeon]|nr:hypothetical protein [Candidatus Bathyarchaeota archaeon]